MSFQLKGVLVIAVLLGIVAAIIWAPWSEGPDTEIPEQIFEPWDGTWQGRVTTYNIGTNKKETHRYTTIFQSIQADSQIGVMILFSPEGDTLARDSLFRYRKGDSLYFVRKDEYGGRDLSRGFWIDDQLIWRSGDIFGRISQSFRERVHKDIWEREGFFRSRKGVYRLLTSRAIRR
jgi:hypothetical protein